jgi:hypothetical protein
MSSAPRVESPFGAQMDMCGPGIVEKLCGALRVCSEPGDTRMQVGFPMIPANESSP